MLRLFGQPAQTGVGFPAVMGKVDTDQGLGPGSEDRRRELAAKKDATPAAEAAAAEKIDRDAITQPGLGKVERQKDKVDELLDGFGPNRPDLPRILPNVDTTPPPEEPVQKELTPTAPGKRQKVRNVILATVGTFVLIVGFGVGIVKLSSNGPTSTTPTAKATVTTVATDTVATTTTIDPQVVPTITTMQVDSLPTASASGRTLRVWQSPHTSPSATAAAPSTTTTTTAAAHPTGSAPPGMNLLPDDPHR
jgi:hypothetical protein